MASRVHCPARQMKLVLMRLSVCAGDTTPASRPVSIDLMTHATLRPSTCMTRTPSASLVRSLGQPAPYLLAGLVARVLRRRAGDGQALRHVGAGTR